MKKTWQQKDFKLGMIGGGQLGRMFIQEAINYNVGVHILDGDPNAPCANLANSFTLGNIQNYDAVFNFGKDKDLITVEIENINIEALEHLEKLGKSVFPQPSVLRIIRDKGIQKQFYIDNNIPTAPFKIISSKEELSKASSVFPAVQKMRTGGYDGKGVQILKTISDLDKAFEVPSILEELIPFKKEISVIVSRNQNGEILCYPAVECEFNPDANLVEFLFAPASISKEVERKAIDIATTIISKLEMVGILAVEFFVLEDDSLLVNEIAPRPHNSGHHTIECNYTSQFEQHLRSILNLPLGNTDIILPGVMINLLGEANYEGDAKYEGIEKCISLKGAKIHLYGKKTTKPFRKMGHLTVINENLEEAKKTARLIQETLKIVSY